VISISFGYRGYIPLAGLVAILILGVSIIGIRAEEDLTVKVSANDAEMNAAIEKARASLSTFWASYKAHNPSEEGHSLKVRFALPDNYAEHIWMVEVKKLADNTYSGRFANIPERLPGKQIGDVAEFREADISDWMFLRNGKIVGGETIRVVLKRMPKEDADGLRVGFETP